MAQARDYLISRSYDFGWFVLPGLVAAIVALAIGVTQLPEAKSQHVGLWIVGVLLVDVAHVYASLYRTYFDPVARERHWERLVWAPILCGGVGFLIHLASPARFWTVLAYIAIFHFIKQQVGFAVLYVRAGRESGFDRYLTSAAVWAGTLAPVIYWHSRLPTDFAWFTQDDFLPGLSPAVGTAALMIGIPIQLAFLARRVQLALRGVAHPMVFWLVLVTSVNWHLGIVCFDDDRIFTLTNVFLHGIPYIALVWVTGGRTRIERGLSRLALARNTVVLAAAFYGLLALLAYAEEALWDHLINHERPQLFGSAGFLIEKNSVAGSAIVALLTVPQATHYLLDRWIWRVGEDNPELAGQLGFAAKNSNAT